MPYRITVEDTNALSEFSRRVRSGDVTGLDTDAGPNRLLEPAQILQNVPVPDGGVKFLEARYFAANAVAQSTALGSYARDVVTGVNDMALFTLGAHYRYTTADLESADELRKVEERLRKVELAGPKDLHQPRAPYADRGWDEVEKLREAHRAGMAAAITQANDYYAGSETATGDRGTTDWWAGLNSDDPLTSGEVYKRVFRTVINEPGGVITSLANGWGNVATRLGKVASQVRKEADDLKGGWDGPSAGMFIQRTNESVSSMTEWARVTEWRADWMRYIQAELAEVQDELESRVLDYQRYKAQQVEAQHGLTVEYGVWMPVLLEALNLLRGLDIWAAVRASGLGQAFLSGGAWVSLPRYPALPEQQGPPPGYQADGRRGTPGGPGGPGVPGGGAPKVPGGGAPAVPTGHQAALRKQQEDLRKQAQRLRDEQERRQKEYNDAVRKLNEDAKKQQDALNQQQQDLQQQQKQQQEQLGGQPPVGQQPEMPGQQDLADMRRQLDDLLGQQPQPGDVGAPPAFVPPPLPDGIGDGLGSVGAGVPGLGSIGAGLAGSGIGGARSVNPTGIPTSGAVDLMGRTGGTAATTGVGGTALSGRATPGPAGAPFLPPMHPPMAGAGGGSPALGGRRNRPVLPGEAPHQPAAKPRVVDPEGDGTTAARRYRDGDRRAVVTDPVRTPEVDAGQALGRLA
ncbi:hypothetical protein [Plantactinospora sp. B5E13]|uniref:hypothetical protein n=1 Tax=unclassified Plantactinospora TaxID=2631981 RepID=UPI00325F0DFD